MNLPLAKFIQNAVEYIGEEANIYENYSGRGMFGKTTAGVVVEHQEFIIQGILEFLKENPRNNALEKIEIDGFRFDNMGRGFIVY